MKAAILILAFGIAAAGLHCDADGCHADAGHAKQAGQAAGHSAQHCCDCLGCHLTSALDVSNSDAAAPVCAPAGFVSLLRPLNPRLVYQDGPFHPPRA